MRLGVMSLRVTSLMVWAGLTAGLVSPSLAAPVYRHIDGDGNVVYSDEPRTGSRVDLKPITVVDPESGATSAPSSAPAATPEPAFEYKRFTITSPSNEQTLPTGQAGNVQVQLAIEPALQRGDRVQLRVDGEIRQSPMHTSVFALSQLERGEHQLQADLIDAQGRVRLSTPPVTLYVQRASVNLPANPNNPNR